jgi:predicted Kef-type K+ transport protein
MEIRKRELTIIALFVLGSIVDHITTYYGLKLLYIIESNPLVALMISVGIWNIFEIALILTGAGFAFMILRNNSKELISLSMTSLGSVGLLRMYAGILNIILISNMIS